MAFSTACKVVLLGGVGCVSEGRCGMVARVGVLGGAGVGGDGLVVSKLPMRVYRMPTTTPAKVGGCKGHAQAK